MITLRAQNNYDTMAASDEAGLKCEDVSLAQQNQKEESDINVILKRFGITGQLPSNVRAPMYGDFTEVGTYQEALNAIQQANASFMMMPAEIRARFNNDPEAFVAFCSDEANREEMKKLGLIISTEPAPAGTGTPVPKPTDTPPGGGG